MNEVMINKVKISLTQFGQQYRVTWQGAGGKQQYNHRDFETLPEAEQLFKDWCTFAKVNKGYIQPR
jgi:hypothetical protein